MSRYKRKAKAVPSVSDDENQSNENSGSDSDVPEGINDLMNLPITLLRKELISRKFQPTVINNLPHWQLSAMLRESTSNNSDSFFNKIMGYSSYWRTQFKPTFTKKAIDEFNQNEEESQGEDVEEEDSAENDDVNAKDFKKNSYGNTFGKDTYNQLDPSNYQQKYINGQFTYLPRTLIFEKIYKRDVPPEYQPPQVIQPVVASETPVEETPAAQNEVSQNDNIDDPNSIPEFVNTKLLNNGVLQSSIDDLTPEQVKKIREEIKSNDFDVQSLIEEYNLEKVQRRIMEDSQFTDTQTQIVDEGSENSNTDSDSSSSSSSDSDSDNDSDSDKNSSDVDSDEKENDDVEDDHMNEIY